MIRTSLLVVTALSVASAVDSKYGPKLVDFGKIIKDVGYPVENHHVINGDKYILELNRIPYSRSSNHTNDRPVIFLMNGLLGSAASFFNLGPSLSPAYNLADAGFDVWMCNARGVLNSRRHLTLDPEDYYFFDFTVEQIALNDLPAMIDYVLAHTGQRKLHYVGHSQGGTVFLVPNSVKPEYNEKFKSSHLLAAVGYQRHFPNDRLRQIAEQYSGVFNLQVYGALKIHAGASLKQIAHYAQNMKDKKFRRWDYGFWNLPNSNLLNYGAMEPPEYNLSLISARVIIHYSKY